MKNNDNVFYFIHSATTSVNKAANHLAATSANKAAIDLAKEREASWRNSKPVDGAVRKNKEDYDRICEMYY